MIELFRQRDDEHADSIEAALQELSAAYKSIVCTLDEARRTLGQDVTLPAVRDEGRVIHGHDALKLHLEDTVRTIERWRRFQSDACYVGDDGKNC